MNANEILEGNKLIAEFMGYTLDKHGNYLLPGQLKQFDHSNHGEWCGSLSHKIDWNKPEEIELYKQTGGYYWKICIDHLEYHSSWDWLMPVVEKIENLQFKDNNDVFKVVIDYGSCFIYNLMIGVVVITESIASSKIEATYKATINFIRWYNNQ